MKYKVQKTDEEWRGHVNPEEDHLNGGKGTPRARTRARASQQRKGGHTCVPRGAGLLLSLRKEEVGGGGGACLGAPTVGNSVRDSRHTNCFVA